MIKYTIQEIIDWAPSFSLLEIKGIQKECFLCFIWILKVSLRLRLIQKGSLCPLRLLPLIRVLCLCPFRVYQGWKNLVHVRVVHQTCTKHRLEGHEILCTNIIFHGNQYILLLHHVFMAINKINITCFDLQAMTAFRLVQVSHCNLHT